MRRSRLEKQEKNIQRLLPKGEKTEDNYLYNISNGDQAIGTIWLARKSDEEGFIYEIIISEKYRGSGYGKEAMLQKEAVGKKLGL